MAQHPSIQRDLPTDFDHAFVPTEVPGRSPGRAAAEPALRIRRYVVREVAVVAVAGRLGEVVEDLDQAIKVALTERTRGVVCDVSAVLPDAEPVALAVLAAAGRHVRDWPGTPLAVACPDPQVREALRTLHLGRHLLVTTSLISAMTAVLAARPLTVERIRLDPDPSAPGAAQDFVTRTLLGWRLGHVSPIAGRVISELVATSTNDGSTHLDVAVVWNLGALRLTVRDDGPDLSSQSYVVPDLARAFGVLPTADGGKVAWAVLNAPRPL